MEEGTAMTRDDEIRNMKNIANPRWPILM